MVTEEQINQLMGQRYGRTLAYEQAGHRFGDDVMQEAYLMLWQNRETVEFPKTWLYLVIRRTARRWRTRFDNRFEQMPPIAELTRLHGDAGVAPFIDLTEDAGDADEVLSSLADKLSARQREVFHTWRDAGYQNKTHADSCRLTRLLKAFREAAGVAGPPRGAYLQVSVHRGRGCK